MPALYLRCHQTATNFRQTSARHSLAQRLGFGSGRFLTWGKMALALLAESRRYNLAPRQPTACSRPPQPGVAALFGSLPKRSSLPHESRSRKFRRMSDKDVVLELVQKLPEDSTLQQISKEIAFLAGIRAAEEQAERGILMDHERIREELRTWISN